MKKHKKATKKEPDKLTPKNSTRKSKSDKPWRLEYKWKSLEDWNKYPKTFFSQEKEYSEEWRKDRWNIKYISSEAAKDYLKSQLRTTFQIRLIQGRFWRTVNNETNEIIEFLDIENYYK